MSWIKDVKEELTTLEISKKILNKFGLLVGGIFFLLGLWIYYSSQNYIAAAFLLIGMLLFVFGLLFPTSLSGVYKVWMGLALTLGWIMSRVLLIVLFYFVLTPIGFIAKLIGKKFLDIDYKVKKESYWIIRPVDKKADYSKMY
jgi:hypothetical protein